MGKIKTGRQDSPAIGSLAQGVSQYSPDPNQTGYQADQVVSRLFEKQASIGRFYETIAQAIM